ncbi:hypothetical protein JW962_01075 [Candidatus Dojkabacteria bacterium]|nr:hypothetical protein [Candidatus Dojkabacteria bacterium]
MNDREDRQVESITVQLPDFNSPEYLAEHRKQLTGFYVRDPRQIDYDAFRVLLLKAGYTDLALEQLTQIDAAVLLRQVSLNKAEVSKCQASESSVNDLRRVQILTDIYRLDRLKQHLSENNISVYSLKWKGSFQQANNVVKPLFFINNGRGIFGNYTLEELEQMANVQITTSK